MTCLFFSEEFVEHIFLDKIKIGIAIDEIYVESDSGLGVFDAFFASFSMIFVSGHHEGETLDSEEENMCRALKVSLERTSSVGKVIGWAPQLAVLSHPAVGGFVSHCGWNSTLESLWFGVPMATWPMYAEQQINAFEMVVELGMAFDIKMDYRNEINIDSKVIVTSEEIERGIRQLMNENEIRKKVKDMKEKSRKALMESGSSYDFLGRMIDVIVHDSFSSVQ